MKNEPMYTYITDMDFVTGGYVYDNYIKPEHLSDAHEYATHYINQFATTTPECQNKPEYSKMYKPKKKTKRGFDAMNIGDTIRFTVDKIYLNGSHTCVVWKDGTKTVVNCADGDYYDEYAAFTAALAKKIYGNNTALKRMLEEKTVVQKPLPRKGLESLCRDVELDPESMSSVIHDACKKLNNALRGVASD